MDCSTINEQKKYLHSATESSGWLGYYISFVIFVFANVLANRKGKQIGVNPILSSEIAKFLQSKYQQASI